MVHNVGDLRQGGVRAQGTAVSIPTPTPADAAGTVRVVTILFADLVGSTRLIHALDPEDARDVLDAALQIVKDSVHASGGTVVRVQGDGVMAAFGLMPAIEDHALHAAIAGCRIRDEMQSRGVATLPGPQVRVGLHSGSILLRWQDNDFGSMLDIVGQAAHVAGRVEQLCPPGSVAVSAATLALIDESTITRPLGSVSVDGRCATIAVHELEQIQLSRADRLPVKGKTVYPLVGRETAITLLRQVIRAAAGQRAGRSDVALAIVGHAGMGKSRLLNEAAQLARQAGLHILAVRGSERLHETPFGCLLAPLRHIAERHGGSAATLASAAGLDLAGAENLAALLGESTARAAPLPPDERSRRMHATIVAVLRHALHIEPFVLLVDDVQYIDVETASLLRDLVRQHRVPGLEVLLAGRPEAADLLATIATRTISLAPLGAADARRLADAILGEVSERPGAAERIAARAGGMPLAIEEFAAALAARSSGDDDDGSEDERLPARLESLFLHRIDRLEPVPKRFCLACCALGPAISLPRLRRIAQATGLDLETAIDALVEQRILELDLPSQVRFTHQLVQEAGYRTMSRRQRSTLHAELYAALLADAKAAGAQADGRAGHAELAHHAEHGGQPEAALRHLWKACEEAVAIAAIETVHAIYRRVRAVATGMGPEGRPQSARFALLAFDALQQLALEQEARDDIVAVADGTVDFGIEARTVAQINMALLEWIDGAPRSARAFLDAAEIGLAEADSFPRRAYAELVAGYVDYTLGEPRAAVERLARLTEALRSHHAGSETFGAIVVVPHILALSFGAWYATDLGEMDRARAWFEEATAISDTLEHNYSRLLARLTHGYHLYRSGDFEPAIVMLRAAHEHMAAHNFFGFEPASAAWLALSLLATGRVDEAAQVLEPSVAFGGYLRVKTSASYYHYEARCRLAMARGDMAQALELAGEALDHCVRNDERLHQHNALVLREQVLARMGGRQAEVRETIRRDLARRLDVLGLKVLRQQLDALSGGGACPA